MLFQPPKMITVMEPWDGFRMSPRELFASLRDELATGELRRGRLAIDRIRSDRAVAWQRDGERSFPVDYSPASIVGVKWPAYWQLLGQLPDTKFVVCVRDPAEVVPSMAATPGRLSEGLDYDIAFNRELNRRLMQIQDPKLRRIRLFDEVYERFLEHQDHRNVYAVRYERWQADPETMLAGLSDFLGVDVTAAPVDVGPFRTASEAEGAEIRALSSTAARLGYP